MMPRDLLSQRQPRDLLAAPPADDKRGSIVDPLVHGLNFGFSDELSGVVEGVKDFATGGSFGTGYERGRDRARGDLDAYRQRHPWISTGAEIAGATPTALIPLGAAARGAALGSKAIRGASLGGLYGGLYGLGASNDDRLTGAATGMIAGGLLGAGAPVASRGLGALAARTPNKKAIPTTEQLKTTADALYNSARGQNLVVEPARFAAMVDEVVARLRTAGIDGDIHPKALAALNRMISAKGVAPTLGDLDTMRKVASQAAQSNEKAETYMASQIIEAVDGFVDGLKPGDVLSGDPSLAASTIKAARDLWARKSKAETIAELVRRAELNAPNFSGSGAENAIRSEFRALAKNPKRLRGFSPEEVAAIERVAKGGPIGNSLRMLGKFAPTGAVSTGVSVGLGGLAGSALGMPQVGAIALPIIGHAARRGATRATQKKADLVDALVRSGGRVPRRASEPTTELMEALLGTANRSATPVLANQHIFPLIQDRNFTPIPAAP